MEVQEFQKKLAQISDMGKKNGNELEAGNVRDFFKSAGLDRNQLMKVIQYLRAQGITVKDDTDNKEQPDTAREDAFIVPLDEEEEAYWKEYRESLEHLPVMDMDAEKLFHALAEGDDGARTLLTQRYLLSAAELAVEMNCEEMHIADLIQEANVSLIAALAETEPAVKSEGWVMAAVRKGIQKAIDEQYQTKFSDDALVQKVEKLEQAIRELNEDEENPDAEKFTAAEIAVILDIPLEELKATLRLTGDDK